MPFVNGIGAPELVIILVIVMIIFGVGRLPEIGGALGKPSVNSAHLKVVIQTQKPSSSLTPKMISS